MHHKYKTVCTLVACLVLSVLYQNCSSNNRFTAEGSSMATADSSGNGGHYDGKIIYLYRDLQNLCSDKVSENSRIEKIVGIFYMVRENCVAITPRLLPSADIREIANGESLVYAGLTFLKARDPWLHPYKSSSLWNVSMGSAAQWSALADPDTADLHAVGAKINAAEWSVPYVIGETSAPAKRIQSTSVSLPLADQLLKFPNNFELSKPAGGIDAFVFVDPSKRWIYHYSACQLTPDGFSCGYGLKDDSCSDGIADFDLGRGVMRKWEIESGIIQHAVRFALPRPLVKPNGAAWPSIGPMNDPTFTGNIIYGSTVGIPGDVDLSTIGLSRGGLILATALQDYGAVQRDVSGTTGGIDFYAEESAQALPQISEMRNDVARIVPYLRILRNQSPSTINGGGTRRKAALLPLDPGICP